jgi:thymidylate kinase
MTQGKHRCIIGYWEMAKWEQERWVVVDASLEWEVVQKELRQTIIRRIK